MQNHQQSNKQTNQRTKPSGFTLIELLVVIVIIGILSTISTATFKSYFGKARDAERRAAVQNLALMIKVDSADKWQETKYIYDKGGLEKLASDNDFRFPRGSKNICYFIGMAVGDDNVGDYNEFIVATWGETGSTAYGTHAGSSEGPIVDGTETAVKTFMTDFTSTNRTLEESEFACAGTTAAPEMGAFAALKDLFSASKMDHSNADSGGSFSAFTYLTITQSGTVDDGSQ